MSRRKKLFLSLVLSTPLFSVPALAANGTWTSTTSPAAVNWSNTGAWSGGTVADAAGFSANFNTIDVPTTGINVTLDSARTIGSLIFGDTTTATAGSWAIAGANTLTLDNTGGTGGPSITVNALGTGATATISSVIAGTAGFTKNGAGTLVLGGANTFTGTTILDGGTLTYSVTPAVNAAMQFGATAGGANVSTVNINQNVTGTSLTSQTTGTNTINIASGKTLSFTGNAVVGFANAAAGVPTSGLTVSGAGTLSLAGALTVGQTTTSATAYYVSTMDLTGLSNFIFNNSGGAINVGTPTFSVGNLKLANTSNTITASTMLIGGSGDSSGNNNNGAGGGADTLVLGAGSNTLNINTITWGAGKSNANVNFGTTTGNLTIRNTAGTGRATITISTGNTNTNNNMTSAVDFSGGSHSVDIQASTLTIAARPNTGGSSATNAAQVGSLAFSAGTVDATTIIIGSRTSATAGPVTGTLTVGGGNLIVGAGGFTLGTSTVAPTSPVTGPVSSTLQINGGTVQTNSNIVVGSALSTITASINLAGGTLNMLDTNGTTRHNIGDATNTVTLNATSGTLKDVGTINGTGGFTKTGSGVLTLTGTNNYTGTTDIQVGAVAINGTATSSAINIGATGILSGTGTGGALTGSTGGASIRPGSTSTDGVVGTLTLSSFNIAAGDFRLDLNTPATSDKVVVTGTANFGGAMTITPTGIPGAGTYTILTSTGISGTVPSFNDPGGTRSTFATSFSGNNLILTVTGNAKSLTWTGANGSAWDLNTTQNWKDTSNVPEKFFNLDNVTFGDGPTNRNITLNAALSPTSTTFTNTTGNDYSITGTGSISGGGGVTVSGTGTVTLGTTNAYIGNTTVNAGTLVLTGGINTSAQISIGASGTFQLGNNDNSGDIGTVAITDNGNFVINRSDSPTVINNITGTGTVTIPATSVAVTMSGSSSYSGGTNVNGGTLFATATSALGTGNITVASGATLDNSLLPSNSSYGSRQVYIAGTGVGGTSGAIKNTTTQDTIFQKITLTADATINTTGRMGISGGTPVLDLAGFTLTKIGTSQMSIVNGTVTSGNISVSAGVLSFQQATNVTGTGTITIADGATLQLSATGATNITRPVTIGNSTVNNNPGSGQTASAIGSNITLTGSPTIIVGNNPLSTLTFAGNIGESTAGSGLIKQNVATLILSGTNSFTGLIDLQAGTLQAGSSGAFNANQINIGSGTVLRAAGNSVTLGQVLSDAGGTIENANASNGVITFSTPAANTSQIISNLQNGTGAGTLGVTAAGGGTLELASSSNTATGPLTVTGGSTMYISGTVSNPTAAVQNGTFKLGGGVPLNFAVTLGSGTNNGALDLNGATTTIGGLTTSGTGTSNIVTNTAGGLGTLTFAGGSSTFGGKFQNGIAPVALNVTSGTLTLTGASTHTGGTNVSGGTLIVNGSFVAGNLTTVSTGGTLKGTGNAGAVMISGGTYAPGNSIGTLNATSLTVSSGDYSAEFTTGSSSDKIAVSGPANFTGASTITPVAYPVPAGNYTLLTSTGLTGTAPTLQNVPTGTRQTYTLNFGTAVANAITLAVTGTAQNLTWVGTAGSAWDLNTTQNWSNVGSTVTPNDKFFQLDTVNFIDGPSNRTLTLNTSANPAAMVINNNGANAYLVNGTGDITGGGTITKSGTGIFTIATNNTFSGTTTINNGVLQIGNGGTSGTLGTSAVGGSGGTLAVNRSDAVTFANNIGGSVAFNQSGVGTTTLSGVNTYSGGTTVEQGILNASASSAIPATTVLTLGSATTNTSGAFDVNGQTITVGGLTTAGTGTANNVTGSGTLIHAGGTSVFSGSIQDSVNLKGASGTLKLTGNNTFTGGLTTMAGGTIQLGNGGTTGSIATTTIQDDGTLAFNRSDAIDFSTVISGAGGVTALGPGALTLSGINQYTGNTVIASGAQVIVTNGNSTGSSLGAVPGGSITVQSGGTLDVSGVTTVDALQFAAKPLFIAGTGVGGMGALVNNGVTQNSGTGPFRVVTLTADATVSNTQRLDIRGGGTGTLLDLQGHTLTKTGGGIFTFFQGTITDGNIDVQAGNLNIAFGATVTGSGLITLQNGTSMSVRLETAFTRNVQTFGTAIISQGFSSGDTPASIGSPMAISNSGATPGLVKFQQSVSSVGSWNGVISDNNPAEPGSIQMNGGDATSTLYLTAANTFSGNTTVTGGTLIAQNALALQNSTLAPPTGTPVFQFDSTVLPHTFTLGGLSGSNNLAMVDNASNTVNLNVGGGTVDKTSSYGGQLTGAGSLTKVRGGQLTFTAAQAYTGATTVNGGTLRLEAANALTSSSGVTVNNTGTLSIGAASQSVTSLTLNTGSTFSADGGLLTTSSTLVTAGTLQFGGTLTLTTAPTSAGIYDLFNWTTKTGTFSTITLPAPGAGLAWHDFGGGVLFNYTTGVVQLDTVATGTPGVWKGASGGSWGTAANWDDNNVPAAATALTFGTAGAGGVVNLNAARNLSANMSIANGTGGAYNLSAGTSGSLNLTGSVTATVTGTQTISAPVTGSGPLAKAGAGTLVVTANNTYSGATNVNVGTLAYGASQTNAAGGINVASGATAGIVARGASGVIDAQPALVNGGGDPSGYVPGDKYVIADNVSVATGGHFDVNDGILVINNGTFSAVNAAVHAGRIFSSTVQYDSNNLLGLTGLGMGDNFDLSYAGIGANNQLTITGSLIPAASDFGQQFIFKYTYIGDANLDGKVTTSDYDFVFGNLGSTTNGVTGNPVIWGDGDFNGNGVVDTTDLDNLFANLGFGTTGNVQPPLLPGTSVPEPSSVALLLLGLAGSAAVIRRKK